MSFHDPRLERCGFAKLQSEEFEYYMKKYEIVLGRQSKNSTVDVILGDNMNISRKHAVISYNFATRKFELKALGKNGVTLRNTTYTPESPPAELRSGDLVLIGDHSFHFLLPMDPSRLFPNHHSQAEARWGEAAAKPVINMQPPGMAPMGLSAAERVERAVAAAYRQQAPAAAASAQVYEDERAQGWQSQLPQNRGGAAPEAVDPAEAAELSRRLQENMLNRSLQRQQHPQLQPHQQLQPHPPLSQQQHQQQQAAMLDAYMHDDHPAAPMYS